MGKKGVATTHKQVVKAQIHKEERDRKKLMADTYREAIEHQAVFNHTRNLLSCPLLTRFVLAMDLIRGIPKSKKERTHGSKKA